MIVEKQNCEMIVIFENARGWLWMSRVWPDSENPDENLKTAPPSFLSMALDGWRDYENLICEKGTIQYRYTTGFSTQNHWPPKKSSLTFSDFVSKTSNVGSRISSEQWKKRFLRIYRAWNPTHLFMWLLYFINVINHDIRIPIKQPGPRFFWLTWNLTKPGGIPISQPLFFSGAKGFTFGREKAASTMEGMTAAPKVVKYIFLHWVWGPNLLRNLPSNARTTGNISPAQAALWSRWVSELPVWWFMMLIPWRVWVVVDVSEILAVKHQLIHETICKTSYCE